MGGDTGTAVTMKTLAERLGVSVTTISNAYSKPDRLSTELREQILAEAKLAGYCGPNAAGRALRSGRNDVCGFLFGGELAEAFADPYTVAFLAGLSESVERFGASVLLLRAPHEGEETEAQLLQRAAIDAIVTCSPTSDHPGMQAVAARGVRVVGAQNSDSGDWVTINDTKAGRLVGKHLDRLGHRRIAVIVPGHVPEGEVVELPADGSTCSRFAAERIRGLREKLPDATITVVSAGWKPKQAGRLAAAHVLDAQDRPTAVVAMSDALALGVWDAARERGLTPGRDLSIVGFDDIPDAGFVGLTTVRQPITDKGRLAGRLAMDPDYPQRQITLPIQLVVRSSTGPAPKN
ncbi:MAG: LacI family DNA-binding transcriptional regulator [Propionibacteriaceae bacterium]|nr:LacI family DNA-binding transcriptional regulator [Propionibacteriaceae bacterium]